MQKVTDIMTAEKAAEFYYWLYENVSPRAANAFIDSKYEKFIEAVRAEGIGKKQ